MPERIQTLSDERVRDLYSWAYAWRTNDDEGETDLSSLRDRQRAEFDAWLAAHDDRIKAQGVMEARHLAIGTPAFHALTAWADARLRGTS